MLFRSIAGELPSIPDDLSIPQFILDSQHELRPDRPHGLPWLVADKSGKTLGLDEIQRRTNALAVRLRDGFGIRHNDPVVFFSSNHIDYPICMWAVHRLLGIVTPCNPSLTVPELVQVLKLAKPKLIVSHVDCLAVAVNAAEKFGIGADRIIVLQNQDESPSTQSAFGDSKTVEHLIQEGSKSTDLIHGRRFNSGEAKTQVAFYSSSSGTTGPPKMVKISHYAFIADIILTAALNKVGRKELSPRYVPGDRCLGVLPFYHIYGLVLILHFNFFAAISVVVVSKFNFADMLHSIDRYKINSLMVVPPQVVLLSKEPIVKNYDLSHIRTVLCSAAPLAGELYDQLIKLVPQATISQAYGSTEATGVVSMTQANEKHGRQCGIMAPGIQGRVVRSDGTLAGYDEEGELHIKTPASAMGYLDNEAATKETFLDDSWMRTGDLVKIDRNDEIVVLDRVKVRGFQVAPAELEGCILDHPLVADVGVVGVPDSFSGEVPLAFVTLTPEGHKLPLSDLKGSLHKHVAENKAPFKHLRYIEVIDSIPKTPSGKLLRRDLREKGRSLVARETKL
ncbi:4-coumarate--CoA ligase-like 7 [Psilocybe cubensis]|uniref:Uncharacterized protein n=2 Tax=Psilocybe cubensis TaxID=181762 RepID=A0A8H8CG50_PSICU|nr:4-coumarate--CoA ligase-like 7 [Psilocybe cubensis]KAH9477438.1 4-coumarate--CoA ligase-like 7 [Psilocybe cubensis]